MTDPGKASPVVRPPFPYYGSKGRLAGWITDLMPAHRVYGVSRVGGSRDDPLPVEVQAGAAPPQDQPPSITCPTCGRTSFNPNDIREGYCGACHDWTTSYLT